MRICPHCRTQYGPDVRICPNDGAPLDDGGDSEDALLGKVLADRYRILRRLGEGGMGRVYLGEHVRMGRMSAVKVMSPSLAPTQDAIARFNREAANASRISHPNVAAIYDFGETADGTLYLAMEYIEGEDLGKLLKHEGVLARPRVAALARQIADALNAAHTLGIIHRDLKPDNILIGHDADGQDCVKVVDFGIAKAARGSGQTVTTAGVSLGTPEYMSPEQIAGGDVDHRSDIYSFGLVVFAMLTGKSPYPELTSKESLVQRLTSRPRPLSEIMPLVSWPPRLQTALDRALSPEPHDRYAKVTDFALDVSAALGEGAATKATRRLTPMMTPPVSGQASSTPKSRSLRLMGFGAAAIVLAIGIGRYSVMTAPGSPRPGVVPESTRTATVGGPESTKTVQTAPLDSTKTPLAAAPESARAAPPPPRDSTRTASAPRVESAHGAGPPKQLMQSAEKPLALEVTPSVSAPSPPAVDPNVAMPPGVRQRPGQHPWLRATGDSSFGLAAVGSPDAGQIQELVGHLNRVRRFFTMQQAPRALQELRVGLEEFGVYAAEHPGAPETAQLGWQFRTLAQRAQVACVALRDSAVAAGRRGPNCEEFGFVAAQARAAQPTFRPGGGAPRP